MSVAQPPVLRKVEEPSIDILIESQKDLIKNLDGMFTGFKNKSNNVVDKHLPLISLTLLNINSNINKIFSRNFGSLTKEMSLFKNSFNENLKQAENQETKIRRSDFGGTHKKREKNVEEIAVVDNKKSIEKNVENIKAPKDKKENTNGKIFTNLFDGLKEGFDKLYDVISSNSAVKGVSEVANNLIAGALGPLNLVVGPLQDLLGVNFTDMIGAIFKKDNPKNKGKKVKPTDSDIKQANPEIFWLHKKQSKENKDDDGSSFGDMLKGVFAGNVAGLAKTLFPQLMKALPFAAIAGGIIWGVIDAIAAIGKADGWGVSKASAAIAGFFAGSGEGGFKDAFKNAGKWALTGAGIGMLAAGPVGALAGGLIGAGIGAVLGFIGGKEIAQNIDATGNKLKEMWTQGDIFTKILDIPNFLIDTIIGGIANFFGNIPKMIAAIFIKDEAKLQKIEDVSTEIFKVIGELVMNVSMFPVTLIKNSLISLENIKNTWKDENLSISEKIKETVRQVIMTPIQGLLKIDLIQKGLNTEIGKKITTFFNNAFDSIYERVRPYIEGVVNFIIPFITNITGSVKELFEKTLKFTENIKTNVSGFFNDVKSKIIFGFVRTKQIIGNIINPIIDSVKWFGNWFYKFFMLKELGQTIVKGLNKIKNVGKFVKESIFEPIGVFMKKQFSKLTSAVFNLSKWITEYVATPIGKFFSKAWETVKAGADWVNETIFSPIKSFFIKAFETIGDAAGWVKETILSPIFEFIKTGFDGIKNIALWVSDNVLTPTKNFFGSIFDSVKNKTKDVIDSFMKSVFGFFNFIGDTFGFIFSGDINIADVISGVTKGGRENLGEKYSFYKHKKEIDRDEKYQKEIETRMKFGKMSREQAVDAIAKETIKVKDAIITPAGRVIEPSSQDTIIATKSPVIRQKKGFDSDDMKINLSEISEKIEQSSKGVEIVDELKKVVNAIKEKPFNNVFQQNEIRNTDFDRYRFAF